ncbi:MAG TPA: ACT domain-containing protein [Candidatus Limnocylindrales bacterium]
MNAFLVDLENKPGELARVTEAIAAKGVDIKAVSGTTSGDRARVAIITSDEDATTAALRGAGCSFRMTDATEISLRSRPGSLAQATRRLAEGEINIEAIMVIGMDGDEVKVAFITDAPAKARTILSMAESALR